jgi:glutathione synthase/RimK-type ligase-like ATP-grasp enzyme
MLKIGSRIGIIYGMENTFPPALVDRINAEKVPGVVAEHVHIGPVKMAEPNEYRVIVDRISHEIDFYRAFLKNAALGGAIVINNPFWSSADDKFFNYALAARLGVAVPNTVVLPQKAHPPGTTVQSMRNLVFPLNWDEVFDYIGFPAFLKPLSKAGWKPVYRIATRDEFFAAYDQTGSTCMILQSAVAFEEYFRCYVVGQEKVRVVSYDPTLPHHLRYGKEDSASSHTLHDRIVEDCLKLCKAVGYEFNMVEFATCNGEPYAIDFLNPVPDADVHSVGQTNFDWIIENVAELAIRKALSEERLEPEFRWSRFLSGHRAAHTAAGAK